jgi:hypothetical protein
LFKASVPVFEIRLKALAAMLDKAETFADAKQIEPGALLGSRLYPNMYTLEQQVFRACDQAKNCAARLTGVDPPDLADGEGSLEILKARIARTLEFLGSIDAETVDQSSERDITFLLSPGNRGIMRGADYLHHYALPNFHFHLAIAHGILRHIGLDIGKIDYIGAVPVRPI